MKELPPGWRRVTFGEAAETALGKMLDKGRPRGLPKVPYLRNINVQWGSIDLGSVLKMELADEERERFGLRAGDLLVCEGGEIGRAAIWRGSPGFMAYQKALHRVRANPGTEPSFLRYQLECLANDGTLARFSTGSTIAHLPQQALRAVPIALPSVKTQRRIVAILEEHLSDLDDAAVGLRGAGAKSIAMVAAARRAAVERAVEVGEPSTVGQRAILVEYGTSHKAHGDPDEGDIPVLRMGNVQDGRLEFATLKYLSPDAPGVRNLVLKRGDLLFNRTNSAELVGKSAVFEADIEATFASYLIRVRFDSSVRPEWANIVVNSPQGRAYITTNASQQVGQANVNGTKLKAFPLPVPSLTDQDEFIQSFREFESAAERLRAQTSRSLARTASLRRAVLAAAFSGRLTGQRSDTDVIPELAEEECA